MDRIDEIKKRHKARKQNTVLNGKATPESSYSRHSDTDYYGTSPKVQTKKPSFFVMKCLIAAALVLGVGIIEKEKASPFPVAKTFIQSAFSSEFNFARVSNWYQQAFGSPLAILPLGKSQKAVQKTSSDVTKAGTTPAFAVPVMGQITQSFNQTNKGVTVQTAVNSPVEAVDSGYVLSITNDAKTGKTVVIQHTNGDQSIYGKLKSVNVKVYDFVKKQQKIGTVSDQNNQGVFYFAFKKGNQYVDPIQVISFG